MFMSFVLYLIVLYTLSVHACLMCDSSISDREKLALPANRRCYSRKKIDQHFHQKSLIFHPDKKTLFSSNAEFICLQDARKRLQSKQCNSPEYAYSVITIAQQLFFFITGINFIATIAFTMRRGKDLTPYQKQ